MSVSVHLTTEASAWRYLVPALFNFSESRFTWEICGFPGGFLAASEHLLKEGEIIFSAIAPGCERYAEKWLRLNGAPSSRIRAYIWGVAEPAIASLPFIQLPPLPPDINAFLLHLKSIHPAISLPALADERAVPLRDRIKLKRILSGGLAAALSKQLAAASSLHPIQKDSEIPPAPIEEPAKDSSPVAHEEPIEELGEFELLPCLELPRPREEEPAEDIDYSSSPADDCPHWAESFTDNPHLPVLTHIDHFGVITEQEAVSILGSPRAARNFGVKIDQYSQLLPFNIKSEHSVNGARYLKSID